MFHQWNDSMGSGTLIPVPGPLPNGLAAKVDGIIVEILKHVVKKWTRVTDVILGVEETKKN